MKDSAPISPPKALPHQRDALPPAKSPALASLEWSQNQRRGSITDPSLYAAPSPSASMKFNAAFRQQPDSASSVPSPGHHDTGFKPHLSDPRPASPYVFGDATPQPVDHGSQIRKLLRSPSTELSGGRITSSVSHESQDSLRNHAGNHMNGDHERQDTLPLGRRNRDYFDFSKRRHSIAAGAPGPLTLPHPSATHGTKRKLSTDRSLFLPVGEEADPPLVGPGVPNIMEVDAEGDAPAPKRRGSTIDTHRIAQLSLEDRRSSVDSRMHPWSFANDRRDSAPALFPPVNMPGFAQALSPNENLPSKLPGNMATFAWDQSNPPLHNDGERHINRPFDPSNQMNMIPPMNFPPDRRMSVPDTLVNPPTHLRRSRSRPPSRQDTGSSSHSGPNSAQEDANAMPPQTTTKSSTPYSRSPELRVSHKLAERQRRKEMKDLYDDLRDQLPQDRGMKASKHETLTKAIEYVMHLKAQCQSKSTEVEALRRELEMLRPGTMPPFPGTAPPPHHQVTFSQIPPISAQFSHLPPPHSQQQQQLPPISSVNSIINQNGHSRRDASPLTPS